MQLVRIIFISILLVFFYWKKIASQFRSLPWLKKIIGIGLILSTAIGIEYFFFDLIAHTRFQVATMDTYTAILSVVIFTVCEGVGIWRLLSNHNDYAIWVLPAIIDIFLKGLLAFLLFNNVRWFIGDATRGIVLCGMIFSDLIYTSHRIKCLKKNFSYVAKR